MKNILHEKAERTRALERKYPLVPVVVHCLIAVLLVVLMASLISWRAQVVSEKKEAVREAQALAEYQAQQAEEAQRYHAQVLAEQKAEEAKRDSDAILMAKMLAGINGFVENYGYSDGDLKTYLECVINRVIQTGYGYGDLDTIEEVVMQKSQWLGFSESNQVIDKYYRIAREIVDNYYDNKARPCSADYCWAELRRDGVWLKNEFGESKYARTWRY